MIATIITVFTSVFIAVGVINEVVLPAGEYAVDKGTEVYDAGKELYQEKIVGTE